ncbi:hypothetical protein [Chitinophaga caseinilytica]|uniref:Uncharacterized protein n=1 Tax=Chitinophaga caseinilytica TaxID=2267521 RepID=A0ABZ2Z1B2_9BACT
MPTRAKISIHTGDAPPSPATLSIRLKYASEESTAWFLPEKTAFVTGIPGDLDGTAGMLRQLGVISPSYRWIFGDGHLVVLGNCLDGSEQSIRLLWFFYGLESSAIKHKGHVHFLPGTMEEKHLDGSWKCLQPPYAPKAINAVSQYVFLYDGNQELFRWLMSKHLHLKIGDMAVVQCRRKASCPWIRKTPADRIKWPVLERKPGELALSELSALRKKLQVKLLLLADTDSGEVRLYQGSRSENRPVALPLIRDKEHWAQYVLDSGHNNPGNPNFPG